MNSMNPNRTIIRMDNRKLGQITFDPAEQDGGQWWPAIRCRELNEKYLKKLAALMAQTVLMQAMRKALVMDIGYESLLETLPGPRQYQFELSAAELSIRIVDSGYRTRVQVCHEAVYYTGHYAGVLSSQSKFEVLCRLCEGYRLQPPDKSRLYRGQGQGDFRPARRLAA
ncbi:MAG: hypothetical protein M0036_14230 [Desulfobacteraceae bacterium]|nr:hypothetical protein [Desulfobacteraceae bacterium]